MNQIAFGISVSANHLDEHFFLCSRRFAVHADNIPDVVRAEKYSECFAQAAVNAGNFFRRTPRSRILDANTFTVAREVQKLDNLRLDFVIEHGKFVRLGRVAVNRSAVYDY